MIDRTITLRGEGRLAVRLGRYVVRDGGTPVNARAPGLGLPPTVAVVIAKLAFQNGRASA